MSDYVLKSLSNQKVHIQSNVTHEGSVTFNHEDDQYLHQMKTLSGVSEGKVLSFDGGANLTCRDEYVRAVGDNLSVSGGELNVDFSSLALSSDVSNLTGNYSSLDSRVNTLESATQYVTSVGANLNVSAGELNVDLSGLALSSDLNDYALTSYVDSADSALDSRVSVLEGAGASYITSVGNRLDVNNGELTVNLSNLVESVDDKIDGSVYKLTKKIYLEGVNSSAYPAATTPVTIYRTDVLQASGSGWLQLLGYDTGANLKRHFSFDLIFEGLGASDGYYNNGIVHGEYYYSETGALICSSSNVVGGNIQYGDLSLGFRVGANSSIIALDTHLVNAGSSKAVCVSKITCF
jgi:hypothetical protein